MASGTVTYDRDKLRAAILHVISSCEPGRLGAVKLHKVLYYSDMLLFAVSGKVITGAAYRKRPFGPTCDAALSILQDLAKSGEIEIKQVDYYGYLKKEFVAKREPDTNRLAESEKSVLNEILQFVCNSNSAKTISDLSHDMVWDMVEFGETIPYHNAIHLIPNETSLDALDWAKSAEREIEASRPKPERYTEVTLAFKDVRAVREGMAELRRVR
jgi:hypothetical protein